MTWDALVPGGHVQDSTSDKLPVPHDPYQSAAPLVSADPFDPLDDGRLVVEEWDEQAYDASSSLLNKDVIIDGYVLPLAWDGDRVVNFLLVPWVGACIHTPAPAPNQIIHVSYAEGLALEKQFEAVRVSGTLQHIQASHNLFLVDGRRQIPASYALEKASLAGNPGEVLASSANELPVTTRVQIWVNTLFADSMTAVGKEGSPKALLFALLLAFAYGALHTLGPGHGKLVVVSYFVGTGGSLQRGLMMGAKIAVFHVLSAVVVVFALDFAVRQSTGSAPSDYRAIRLGSYALIMLIGTVMLWQAIRLVLSLRTNPTVTSAVTSHSHGHSHNHPGRSHSGCSACAATAAPKGGGWIAASVGVVPCTGALLVMLFGLANDLVWPAILMVAAISAGMAVAMSAIGVAALGGRSFAERRFAGNHRRTQNFEVGARLAGSACVFAIGTFLFVLTWSSQPLPQVSSDAIAVREASKPQIDG